jgi:hypothetical protein
MRESLGGIRITEGITNNFCSATSLRFRTGLGKFLPERSLKSPFQCFIDKGPSQFSYRTFLLALNDGGVHGRLAGGGGSVFDTVAFLSTSEG